MSIRGGPWLLSETLYCVPRRYDLATLFFVTTAYAFLFALLRWIRLPPEAVVSIAALLACVGIAQALLFRGKAPRAASIIVGSVFLDAVILIRTPGPTPADVLVPTLIMTTLFGVVVGYLCGVLVGGVFLVADAARNLVTWLTVGRRGLPAEEDLPPGGPEGSGRRKNKFRNFS